MNAHDVAAAIIAECREIDSLKLQKLLFLVAGEYSSLVGRTMFAEPLEAWEYGPVVYEVYKAYQSSEGVRAITLAAEGEPSALDDVARCCVESVVARFGHMTGPQLIKLTHTMAPWRSSYRAHEYRTQIDPQAIYDYFSQAPSDSELGEALSAWNSKTPVTA